MVSSPLLAQFEKYLLCIHEILNGNLRWPLSPCFKIQLTYSSSKVALNLIFSVLQTLLLF